jgi:ectoine hydroxylase-related dioxygenase (phytanoyl-CoA dioxygenase family)
MRSSTDIAENYNRDGFVFPIDVLTAEEAASLRADLEAAEAEVAHDPEKLSILRTYTDRVLPAFDSLVRHETLINAASAVLGPDLMVWSAQVFVKEAGSPKIISWHQDLTYWGLDDAEEATCWVALSPVTQASGCMRFVPGSHTEQIVAHVDTFDDNNMLSRGQEIAVDVDEADAVLVQLQPGQASLHHGHLFHASGPNTSDDRRIGLAIRYIKTSMKQESGDKCLVSHVSGEDRFGHFKVAGTPKGRLQESDFDLCRADLAIKQRVLFEGAEPEQVKGA